MGELGGQAALLADLDRLGGGLADLVALIAHVGDVHAAVARGDLGELDRLLGGREGSRQIEQPGAHAHGAVAHALVDERAHAVELGGRGRPVIEPNRFPAHGVVADEAAVVDAQRRLAQLVQERAERQRAAAVVAFDDRGDPLAELVLGVGSVEDGVVGVVVNVDKARATTLPAASMVLWAVAADRRPMAATRSPRTAMSPWNQGLPAPSMMRPLRMSRS